MALVDEGIDRDRMGVASRGIQLLQLAEPLVLLRHLRNAVRQRALEITDPLA